MTLEEELELEIQNVKNVVQDSQTRDSEDFNVRGELYRLAFLFAPNSRDQDIHYCREWIAPREGEKSVDIAAGTGFLTKHVAQWTKSIVYAIDPSDVQLRNLEKNCQGLPVKTIVGSLSDQKTLVGLGGDVGNIDFVTSFGGIHHCLDKVGVNSQKEMFKLVSKALKKGGRFIAADVGDATKLSEHFEVSVKRHCLTGHEEKWLSAQRLKGELIDGTDLKYIRSEVVPIQWVFTDDHQMAMFMKGLHAYDLSEKEILDDLQSILGYEHKEGGVYLNWPMLFFHLEKA